MLNRWVSQIIRLIIMVIFTFISILGQADSLQEEMVGTAALSITLPTMALIAGSGKAGVLTISNQSRIVTARNIQAILPPSWTDVTQNASDCLVLPPGKTCSLQIIPGNTVYAPEVVSVQGSNTTMAQLTISFQGLLVTTAPANVTIDTDQVAVFSTSTSGGIQPYHYQWQVSTNGGLTFNNVTTGTGGVTATYTTTSLTTADSGNLYRVLISDSGIQNITSAAAILSVNAVLVTSTPANVQRPVGQTATFSTITTGGQAPYAYQWQVSINGGLTFNNVSSGSGGNTASYTTAPLSLGDSGNQYRVIVSDALSSQTTSAPATLTVSNYAYVVDDVGTISICAIQSDGTFGSGSGGQPCTSFSDPTLQNPKTLVLNSTNTFAYITNFDSNTISVCPVLTDGTLAACTANSAGGTLNSPQGLAINSSDSLLYITNFNGGNISICSVSGASISACAANGTFSDPTNVVLNNSGTAAYVSNFAGGAIATGYISNCPIIGSTFGVCTNTNGGGTITYPVGAALNAANSFVYVVNNNNPSALPSTITICDIIFASCTTPTGTFIPALSVAEGLALSTDNTLAYITSSGNSIVYSCQITGGGATLGVCTANTDPSINMPFNIYIRG